MEQPFLMPPNLDDETVVKLHDFLYELLDLFEVYYSYQIARHERNSRYERLYNELQSRPKDEPLF